MTKVTKQSMLVLEDFVKSPSTNLLKNRKKLIKKSSVPSKQEIARKISLRLQRKQAKERKEKNKAKGEWEEWLSKNLCSGVYDAELMVFYGQTCPLRNNISTEYNSDCTSGRDSEFE